jgi:hypothetical protein
MGQSAGTGSPVWFKCHGQRQRYGRHHQVERTGRERRYRPPRGSALGIRSDYVAREYVCRTCGHRGWSNHVDLIDAPGPPTQRALP